MWMWVLYTLEPAPVSTHLTPKCVTRRIWLAHALFNPDEAGDYCVLCLLIAYLTAELMGAAMAGYVMGGVERRLEAHNQAGVEGGVESIKSGVSSISMA